MREREKRRHNGRGKENSRRAGERQNDQKQTSGREREYRGKRERESRIE